MDNEDTTRVLRFAETGQGGQGGNGGISSSSWKKRNEVFCCLESPLVRGMAET